MPESSIVVRPEPMGGPSYRPSKRLAAAGLARAIALFTRAAETVPLHAPPQPVVIADYGASSGYNSLLPIGAAIAAIRRRTRSEHAVLVAHTDLPDNDFTALFRTLAEDPDSYLLKDAASFPSAVGRSFYAQILPSLSVTLGWTSWSIMWLRRTPAEIPDHVVAARSANDATRSAYARQAATDWQDFLAFRGRELRPGGRLLVLTAAVAEDGEIGYRPLLDAIVAALNDLVGQGLLQPDEVRRMVIPMVARSEKEFCAPFAPSDRFEGLSIEHLEVFNADDRFWAQYLLDQDAEAFGARWAALARATMFEALAGALDGGPADARATEFRDRLQTAVAAGLTAAPQQMMIPLAAVVLVKQDRSG